MTLRPVSILFALALALVIPAAAQESTDVPDSAAPVLTVEQPPNSDSLGVFSQEPTPPALFVTQETAVGTTSDEYRITIKKLSAHKHSFVHIKLKNGKVLTGLVRDVGDQGFSLNTDALGGPYILYRDLAEGPRPTPAVGTRIKHGAEWTGLVALVLAAIPIMLPLIFTGVISDC